MPLSWNIMSLFIIQPSADFLPMFNVKLTFFAWKLASHKAADAVGQNFRSSGRAQPIWQHLRAEKNEPLPPILCLEGSIWNNWLISFAVTCSSFFKWSLVMTICNQYNKLAMPKYGFFFCCKWIVRLFYCIRGWSSSKWVCQGKENKMMVGTFRS